MYSSLEIHLKMNDTTKLILSSLNLYAILMSCLFGTCNTIFKKNRIRNKIHLTYADGSVIFSNNWMRRSAISRIMQIEEGVLFFISCESPNSISVLYPSVLFRCNFQTLKSFSHCFVTSNNFFPILDN